MKPEAIPPELAQIISDLRAEVQSLQTQLEGAQKEIQRLKQIPELPPEATQMLVRLANTPKSIPLEQVAHSLGLKLSQAKLDYCRDALFKHKYIEWSGGRMGGPLNVYATAAGREYLLKANLL